MDSDVNTILMTYAELGKKLSIKPASAKRLAQRRKWHRIVGNDGAARVHVPLSVAPKSVLEDVPADVSGDIPDDMVPDVTPGLSARIVHLEGVIEVLQGQLEAQKQRAEAEQRRADAAESRIQDIAADRDAWRQQARRSLWSRLFGSP